MQFINPSASYASIVRIAISNLEKIRVTTVFEHAQKARAYRRFLAMRITDHPLLSPLERTELGRRVSDLMAQEDRLASPHVAEQRMASGR